VKSFFRFLSLSEYNSQFSFSEKEWKNQIKLSRGSMMSMSHTGSSKMVNGWFEMIDGSLSLKKEEVFMLLPENSILERK
jgi:hypothetical protein